MKMTQHELKKKIAEEIDDLKKQIECLIVKNTQLIMGRDKVEAGFDEACKHVYENIEELDAVAKAKQLGEVIVQLQLTNNLLNSMVYLEMAPEQIVEHNDAIEFFAAQFEAMEQEAKKISEERTQFWGSVIQDEQLDQLTMQAREADNKLTTLKMKLRTMLLMVQVPWSIELRELQQRDTKA